MSKTRVTLAYPVEIDGKAHKPDETVSVDDYTARVLIQDGKARPASKADNSTKEQ